MIDINSLKLEGKVYLGNTGELYRYSDEDGNAYLFKPAYKKGTKIQKNYKAYAQEAAYQLQNIIDPQSAVECVLVEVNGVLGTIQREIPLNKNLTRDVLAFQINNGKLTPDLIKALMREYITDYLLCNYDSTARNVIVGSDGILRGIDKEQAFRYITEQGSDDPKFSINFNSIYRELPSIYKVIFEKIQNRELSPDILEYTNEYIEKIKNIPVEEYKSIFEKYVNAINPEKKDIVLEAILKRKETLEQVIANLKSQFKSQTIAENLKKTLMETIYNPIITNQTKKTYAHKLSYEESAKIDLLLGQSINYCIVLKSNEDLLAFLNISDSNGKLEFLKRKVAQKLGIDEEQIEERKDDIYKYIWNEYNVNGYVFHTTNSVSAEKIKREGLSTTSRLWDNSELIEIQKIYEKYGEKMPIGWGYLDIKDGKSNWFYDRTPTGIIHYSGSPEWFDQFCGNTFMYYGKVSQEERNAYKNRDYDTALNNIKLIQKELGFSTEDSERVLSFFNKYWEMFKDATQTLIMVPKSNVPVTSYDAIKERYENNTQFRFNPNETFYEMLEDMIVREVIECKDSQNCKSEQDVNPDELLFIDILPLFEKKKISLKQDMYCQVSFGKHEQIEYAQSASKFFSDMVGDKDTFFFRLGYNNYDKPEVKEILKIVESLSREGKVFRAYCINKFGEATIEEFDIVGGFYCTLENLEEIISRLSAIKNLNIVGLDKAKQDSSKYSEQLEMQQLIEMIKGLSPEQVKTAKALISNLSNDEVSKENTTKND